MKNADRQKWKRGEERESTRARKGVEESERNVKDAEDGDYHGQKHHYSENGSWVVSTRKGVLLSSFPSLDTHALRRLIRDIVNTRR